MAAKHDTTTMLSYCAGKSKEVSDKTPKKSKE